MARTPRRNDPDRDPADDEDQEYSPPSKRTAAIVIVILVAAGLTLIAYFILELDLEDLGGTGVLAVAGALFFVIARARLFR